MKTLHILNGDAISGAMDQAGITGERMVWREMLSDGPSIVEMGTPQFFALRMQFFMEEYEVSAEKYQELTISEFEKLDAAFDSTEEFVLWFEYDLFCQVNMLACLAWFAKQDLTDKKISLICVGEFPGYDRLVALGELDAQHYPKLFRERRPLRDLDIGFAVNAWKSWCSVNPRDMIDAVDLCPPAFPYLKLAFHQHRGRFPSSTNGLNVIENKFLSWIAEGANSRREVVKRALTRGNIFGFGDMQYFNYLEHLNPLLAETEEGLVLNPEGEAVLVGKRSFQSKRKEFFMGGANVRKYRWNPGVKQLEPIR